MTRSGDDHGEMAHRRPRSTAGPLLDELTAERLVSGAAGPGDVPPAYAPVARLLQAATAPARDHELEGEDLVRQMFLAELGTAGSVPSVPGRGPKRSGPIARRFAAAAVVAGSLVVGGGVAAATGNLPAKAQSAAHDTLDAIGVDVPEPPEEREAEPAGDDAGEEEVSPFCAAATEGPCAVALEDQAEDQGSVGGDEPTDPGDLGGAPGSTGPPSSTLGGSTDPSASTSEDRPDPTDSTSTDPSDPQDSELDEPEAPTDPPSDDPEPPDEPELPPDTPPTSDTTIPETPPTSEEPPSETDPDRSGDPEPEPTPDPEPTP